MRRIKRFKRYCNAEILNPMVCNPFLFQVNILESLTDTILVSFQTMCTDATDAVGILTKTDHGGDGSGTRRYS